MNMKFKYTSITRHKRYRINNKLVIFILFSDIYFLPTLSHPITDLHNLCSSSLDYRGCIEFHNNKEDKQRQFNQNEPQWRNYGPIKVQWSMWQSKGNNYVAPSLNAKGKAFFIAVNCKKMMLNTTGPNNEWKGWFEPLESFEKILYRDRCE